MNYKKWPRNPTSEIALKNCLFGKVKLTRDIGKCKVTYNG